MRTAGYVFILLAILVIRGVTKGRGITQLPGDLGAMFTALVTGNQGALSAALAQTGTGATDATAANAYVAPTTTTALTPGGVVAAGSGSAHGAALLTAAHTLATAAGNRYVFGTNGPASYDCSGLVSAAMAKAGLYNGLRFSTYTFAVACSNIMDKTTTPAAGDVVLWTSHMGIMDSTTTMFSALNAHYGILSSPLSWGPSGEGSPTFYRLK